MNQQNSKTHVQQLLHKARTRQNCFPFGLIISQGHNSFECLFEAYSELWRKIKIEQQMMTGKNSWAKKCHHQLLPCYLEIMQEDFLNGSTSGLCPHAQLSHNSLYASAYVTPFHPSLHCSYGTLHGGSVLCYFYGGNEVVFPDQWFLGTGSCFKYILDSDFFFYAE